MQAREQQASATSSVLFAGLPPPKLRLILPDHGSAKFCLSLSGGHRVPSALRSTFRPTAASTFELPTNRQPGFDLSRPHCSTSKSLPDQPRPLCILSLKEVGPCSNRHVPLCKRQTMSHIVNSCPQTKLEGGLQQLHSADDVATEWLKTRLVNALDNNNNYLKVPS